MSSIVSAFLSRDVVSSCLSSGLGWSNRGWTTWTSMLQCTSHGKASHIPWSYSTCYQEKMHNSSWDGLSVVSFGWILPFHTPSLLGTTLLRIPQLKASLNYIWELVRVWGSGVVWVCEFGWPRVDFGGKGSKLAAKPLRPGEALLHWKRGR